MAALQKRTPPCCCALAVDVGPCRSACRRAVVPSGCRRARSVKANPVVLFCSGWRSARQKRTPPCCCALADMAGGGPPGEGGLFDPPEGGGGGAWAVLVVALGRPKGDNFRDRLRRHREARLPSRPTERLPPGALGVPPPEAKTLKLRIYAKIYWGNRARTPMCYHSHRRF
jgi:hypothetical protein